jgi:hypothetical protein
MGAARAESEGAGQDVGLLLEGSGLLFLCGGWGLESSQGLVWPKGWELLESGGLAEVVADRNRVAFIAGMEDRVTRRGENGAKVSVGALIVFEDSSTGPEDIAPQLGVMGGAEAKGLFFRRSAVHLATVIVHEASHADAKGAVIVEIDVGCAVTVMVVDIKIATDVEGPDGGRGAAALARSKDWIWWSILVWIDADPQLCLDFIHGVDEHVTVDGCYVAVKPHCAGDHVGNGGDNAVVARPCVIAEFYLWPSSQHGVVVLEHFDEDGVEGGATSAAAVAASVEGAFIFAEPEELPEFDAKEQVVVGFVQMDDAKAVEFRVAGFFFYHRVDDLLPAIKAITICGCILEDTVLSEPNFVACFLCFFVFDSVGCGDSVRMKQGMLMA